MYQQLARMTGLAPGETTVSEPVAIGQHNTVQIDLTVFSGEVKVTLQETNDLQGWTVRDTYSAVTGPGHRLLAARSICCSYVRVQWEEATSVNRAVVAGGIHCSRQ